MLQSVYCIITGFIFFMPPLQRREGILLCTYRSVCLSVCFGVIRSKVNVTRLKWAKTV